MATRDALQNFAGMTGAVTCPVTPADAAPLMAQAPDVWTVFIGILVQASVGIGA